jgi:glucose-1-phosphate cytidylyltransferase
MTDIKQVVILAGGKGTRLHETTGDIIPKPLVEIGGLPILYHILSIYGGQGVGRAFIATGHKGDLIAGWVDAHRKLLQDAGIMECVCVDTGEDSGTGGRIRRVAQWLYRTPFHLTYGDGLGNVDLGRIETIHGLDKKNLMTITAAKPPARFGAIQFDDFKVVEFGEKTQSDTFIAGGYMVVERRITNHIANDDVSLEYDVMPVLARHGLMGGYRHAGYWQMMDTPRDHAKLEQDYQTQTPPPWMAKK